MISAILLQRTLNPNHPKITGKRKMSETNDYSSDSDVPEELTAEQGKQKEEELRKVLNDTSARAAREKKNRRRLWAQKKTPKPPSEIKDIQDASESQNMKDVDETEKHEESQGHSGMLASNIVEMLAAREKQVFTSDSEEEKPVVIQDQPTSKRKKQKSLGSEPVILKEISPPPCTDASLEFLKKRKAQVPRSTAVLNNSKRALRLLHSSGLLS